MDGLLVTDKNILNDVKWLRSPDSNLTLYMESIVQTAEECDKDTQQYQFKEWRVY